MKSIEVIEIKNWYKNIILILSLISVCGFSYGSGSHHIDAYEEGLIRIFNELNNGDYELAVDLAKEYSKAYPSAVLINLLYNDMKLNNHKPFSNLTGLSSFDQTIQQFKDEAILRWSHYNEQRNAVTENLVPEELLHISDAYSRVAFVDLDEHRLYTFNNTNGKLQFEYDYYISIGKNGYGKQIEGDSKTPIGVYFIESFIADEKLPDLYGAGALTLNYPNNIDKMLNRTGYGIWLHGTPSSTYNRIPKASEGCVVLNNNDFKHLHKMINNEKIPTILSKNIQWVDSKTIEDRKQKILAQFNNWISAWESMDIDVYLSYYHADKFSTGKKDYNQWADHKRNVNGQKSYIDINISDVNIFKYPDKENIIYITYTQDYSSDNHTSLAYKEQFWEMQTNGKYKIIHENSRDVL